MIEQLDPKEVRTKLYSANVKLKTLKEKNLKEDLKNYRALYWARYFHRNTRMARMSFKDLYYLVELYKQIDNTPKMVVEKSVQCGLSELFIIQSHIEAGERGMTVMYILPKYELRNRFVNNRIYKLHKRVLRYQQLITKAATKVHRTSLMHFGAGTLAYVGSNVSDEFIEIPVDSAYIDEKDRCNLGNLLMLPDRLTASPYKYQREISNPTTESFGIDERYLESSKGMWNIKCSSCGQWFVPDFFKHVVREIGSNVFAPRDSQANPDPLDNGDIRLIHDCGAPVDRLQWGEWVHAYPGREWAGFRISKIFSTFASMRQLYRGWTKAVGNSFKTQIFYNSDLGLPFSSDGSKITQGMLNDCRVSYEWPVRNVSAGNARLMGVDVGKDLHVVLRERVKDNGVSKLKLINVWVLPGFSSLEQLIREWRPNICMIDAQPEIHKILELKDKFSSVWSSRFQADAPAMTKNKDKREVRMDRTALLDYVKQGFSNKLLLLPLQAESILEGEYYKHLMASTRILEANKDHPEKSRFVWKEGGIPDHLFLAESYCFQAGLLMPDHGIFDFFANESENLNSFIKKSQVSGDTVNDDEREKIADLKNVTPEIFLKNKFDSFVSNSKIKANVNVQRITDVCIYLNKSEGYVELINAARMSQETEEDVRGVLVNIGFVESRIKNQYIKE